MTLAPFVKTGIGVSPMVDLELLRSSYPNLPADVWNVGSASDLLAWESMRVKFGITAPDAIPCEDILSANYAKGREKMQKPKNR